MPEEGGSSAPRMYSSELLPLPEGPVMAAASPGFSENETSEITVSGPRGVAYCFVTFATTSPPWARSRDTVRQPTR